MLHVGEIQVALVSDGVIHVDAGGPFGLTPRALYGRYLLPDADNLVPQTLTNLLLRIGGKTIIVDTGYGSRPTEKQRAIMRLERPNGTMLDHLARLGVQPGAVDLVINTHLHVDHCSGNTYASVNSESLPTFPNAEYVVQRREYEDAMRPNERTRATYLTENNAPLVASGQMLLLDGDAELAPGVWGVVAPGHTPGLMVIRLESGGQHALYVGDLAMYGVHFEKLGWMTAYDVEPLRTLESKRRWQAWARETDAILIFQHDPTLNAARLNGEGKIERVDVGIDGQAV